MPRLDRIISLKDHNKLVKLKRKLANIERVRKAAKALKNTERSFTESS